MNYFVSRLLREQSSFNPLPGILSNSRPRTLAIYSTEHIPSLLEWRPEFSRALHAEIFVKVSAEVSVQILKKYPFQQTPKKTTLNLSGLRVVSTGALYQGKLDLCYFSEFPKHELSTMLPRSFTEQGPR